MTTKRDEEPTSSERVVKMDRIIHPANALQKSFAGTVDAGGKFQFEKVLNSDVLLVFPNPGGAPVLRRKKIQVEYSLAMF